MPPKTEALPPQVAIIITLIWLVIMGTMVVSYIIVLITLWKGMRAHQKIAEKLGEIADKLQLK